MLELSPQEKPDETVKQDSPQQTDDRSLLRQLLLAEEQAQLAELQDRIEDPHRRAEDLSQVLPESISLRASKDKTLTKALTPTVEEAIHISVKKNPQTLVDAIFPVIGPAIRKAIASALREMVQSLNQALEYSLSVKGLKWRLEALRTGKSFAEVVLSHTLLYRVEQVFLIHKETGLLLAHVTAPAIVGQDADMVSGMLTAIQDFVRDSFGTQDGEGLDLLEVGQLNVWIEQGPRAYLAAVIRGNAPQDYRAVLQDAIETIHLEQPEALEDFQGDAAPFAAAHATLENCLQSQAEEKKKQTSPLLYAVAGLVVLALGLWIFFALKRSSEFERLVDALKSQPGIIVLSTEKRDGNYFITGLCDPLAKASRDTVLQGSGIGSHWETYYSSHPDFVLNRAQTILQPPDGVRLQFAEEAGNGILRASGIASQNWLAEARRLSGLLPAVDRFDTRELVNAETLDKDFQAAKERIEKTEIPFDPGSAILPADQNLILSSLAEEIRKLQHIAQTSVKVVRVEVYGYADRSGSEALNQRLEQERAATVLSSLFETGIPRESLLAGRRDSRERPNDRKVTFRVITQSAPETKP
jgi:OOP family OmpA-OmpF porin